VAASAFLVQLAFMPALIVVLGDRAWWVPGWLDRLLPRVAREAHPVARERPEAETVVVPHQTG
jgi:RND superfamily putative drug exporter